MLQLQELSVAPQDGLLLRELLASDDVGADSIIDGNKRPST